MMSQGWGAIFLLTSRAKSTYKMTVPHVIRILLLFALLLAICSPGSAASLQGKVAEVVDGGTIAVVSVNHLLKVRLIAVAAPEKNQSYAGVARCSRCSYIGHAAQDDPLPARDSAGIHLRVKNGSRIRNHCRKKCRLVRA